MNEEVYMVGVKKLGEKKENRKGMIKGLTTSASIFGFISKKIFFLFFYCSQTSILCFMKLLKSRVKYQYKLIVFYLTIFFSCIIYKMCKIP